MTNRLSRLLLSVTAGAVAIGAVVTGGVTAPAQAAPTADKAAIDLQSHRGGRGEHTEESLYGFAKSIELGVTTLELDVVLTRDGVPLVWHDPEIMPEKCRDTVPASLGDRQFPYVGKDVHDLTYRQIQTLVCDLPLKDYPAATPVLGNRIATLPQLFGLAAQYRGNRVRFNIETKIEAEKRSRSATPQQFVDTILREVRRAGLQKRVEIQSFDWRSLPLVRAKAPSIPLVALYDETTWTPSSRWLGPVTYQQFGGDVVAAAAHAGFDILSPAFALSDASLVSRAHSAGLRVVPWTVNEKADMRAQLRAGVDGIITDYPTRLREVLAADGRPLPKAYRRK
ncbi:glycerophosphodiester phosphodiesterase [Gordonia hydrophobica]|uniref:Glycerophosphodiester phosphodiesterase n=1 Tax=Gordonia hydrophobica TaxID=40516 RepID=A0ABZ2U235_9ACTN|nr:glycerophosphodiester phosphodiesterase [Gordonia hydrophobica]MBM7366706.1 glycerophosphoryl diester phosphodiesterase [Gordonia hydrophobica]